MTDKCFFCKFEKGLINEGKILGGNINKDQINSISKKISTKTGTGYGLNIVTKLS